MREDLWEEAYKLACQHACEEGDVDIDKDYVIMERWQEEYYQQLLAQEGEN